jgi:hypothetical protein
MMRNQTMNLRNLTSHCFHTKRRFELLARGRAPSRGGTAAVANFIGLIETSKEND